MRADVQGEPEWLGSELSLRSLDLGSVQSSGGP